MLAEGGEHVGPEIGVALGLAGDADNGQPLVQQALAVEVVEGRGDLPGGQVAGGPEEDEEAGRGLARLREQADAKVVLVCRHRVTLLIGPPAAPRETAEDRVILFRPEQAG